MRRTLALFFVVLAFTIRFIPLKIPNVEFISSMIAFLTLAYGLSIALSSAVFVTLTSNLLLMGTFTGWDIIVIAGWISVSLVQFALKGNKIKNILQMQIFGTLTFYFVTNSLVFLFFDFYPKSTAGYFLCLTAGIPFMRNQLIANLVFSFLVYKTVNFVQRKEALQEPARA